MTKKIFRSTVAVGLAVLLASLVIIMGALYTYFGHVQEQQLRDELSIAAAAMESGDGEAYLSKLHSDNYRITWLRADGTVLYDTKADAAAMENHAQREEVRQALANGTGESSRYSATLLEKTLYYARRLPDGTVLRLSASRVTMG
ncbi:MAG: two-component sensor histidine kinase, partial [Oscillospiraceae bacterium]